MWRRRFTSGSSERGGSREARASRAARPGPGGCRKGADCVLFPAPGSLGSLSPSAMHYLDYAATSAVRPESVAGAVHDFLVNVGASPGRGGYAPSVESGRIALRCRRQVARVMGLPGDPGRIAFMMNATHALNTAIHGVVGQGDPVVITPFDHNAVLRPVHALSTTRGVEIREIPGAPDGTLDLEAAATLLEGARLLVVNAVSNVLGTILPLPELASLARERGVLVLVDAAQSAGHLPHHPASMGAHMVAFTGHKGLLGPQGTGGLWVEEGTEVLPFCTGGTGGNSRLREMPATYPDHLEAGTPNAPGIAGLLAGCQYVLNEGVEVIHAREAALKARLHDGLSGMKGVRVLSPAAPEGAALVTLTLDGMEPAEVARRLEDQWGVLARAGLHCAPEAHRLLGSRDSGALRLSLGWASSDADVDQALAGVDAISLSLRTGVPGGIPA
ncbi:MAG: aminotransferase class V-fold PLP-dependent enzyme [Gemmatimonadales bacterium]|nr:MAG: aminotransferase class V-fold PLP-dependent enzyme [Gemmatimonadales bacterium]